MKRSYGLVYGLALVAALTGCGGRPDSYGRPVAVVGAVGLRDSVAVVDDGQHQAIFLHSPGDLRLEARYVPVGLNVSSVSASKDLSRLFLLSRGISPRRDPKDQKPRFTMIDTSLGEPQVTRLDELEQALSGLALDDGGEWVAIYDGGSSAEAYVTNPNEVILISLTDLELPPISVTLPSQGGRPQRLHFTAPLAIPGGESHRFLIVEREHDLALVDLANSASPEITTVGSPENGSQKEAAPAEVVYYPGDEDTASQFAVRYGDDSSVGLLELETPTNSEQNYDLSYNLVDVGGTPSAIEFVRTDGGLRLAAIVPATAQAVLVDAASSATTNVDLDAAFTGLKLVTEDLASRPNESDVALLFSTQATEIGFWALGQTAGKPYRSFETQEIGVPVASVYDVPGATYPYIKVLKSANGGDFFVLDLNRRESYPMEALSNPELKVAPDGDRVWAYASGGYDLARIDFDALHPISLSVERPIAGVFDIARPGTASAELDLGRAVVVLHTSGDGLSATVFDALAPDNAHSRFFSGFEFGGLGR